MHGSVEGCWVTGIPTPTHTATGKRGRKRIGSSMHFALTTAGSVRSVRRNHVRLAGHALRGLRGNVAKVYTRLLTKCLRGFPVSTRLFLTQAGHQMLARAREILARRS